MNANLIGQKFGRLTVIALEGKRWNARLWLCKCDCGNEHLATTHMLNIGKVHSCGCLVGDVRRMRNIPNARTKNGGQSKTYMIWANMLQRCKNPKHDRFPHYGGRGISVCPEWKKFSNFIADMGACPEGYSIERKNVDGNYEPSNCLWIPMKEQAQNTTFNHIITFRNEALPMAVWAKRIGINSSTLAERLDSKNWSFEDAMTLPAHRRKKPILA